LCPPSQGRVLLFDGGLLHVSNHSFHTKLFCVFAVANAAWQGVCPVASDGITNRCSMLVVFSALASAALCVFQDILGSPS
jgi:hypothetical protein